MVIHLSEAGQQTLDQLAADQHMAPEEYVAQAVEQLMAEERAYMEYLAVGDAQAAAGQLIDHEDVMAMMWRALGK